MSGSGAVIDLSTERASDKPQWAGGVPAAVAATAGVATDGLGEAVKNNREDHDPHSADGGETHIQAADAAQHHLAEAAEVFDEVENSPVMQDLWAAYQKKFSYASDLGWDTVMAAVRQLFVRCEGAV